MTKPTDYFAAFVTIAGGREKAKNALQVSRATIGHLLTGKRRASPQLAIRIEQASGGAVPRSGLRPDLWQGNEANNDS